jgi:hypothetical protein
VHWETCEDLRKTDKIAAKFREIKQHSSEEIQQQNRIISMDKV